MTTTGGPVVGQLGLFGDAGPDTAPEPVLMALHREYYELIWRGLKTHEFRRRFVEGRATRWFVYINAPVSRLGAVIDLGPAVMGSPEEVAVIAEQARPGNGSSVLEYVRDLDRAFAIPILRVAEYPGLSAEELRAELGTFHPPQGYVRLAQHPEMLAVCEKVATEGPIRTITVHHRLYRFRCRRQRPVPADTPTPPPKHHDRHVRLRQAARLLHPRSGHRTLSATRRHLRPRPRRVTHHRLHAGRVTHTQNVPRIPPGSPMPLETLDPRQA